MPLVTPLVTPLVRHIQRALARAMLVEVDISRYYHSQVSEEGVGVVEAACVVDCRNVLGEDAFWYSQLFA